MQQIKLYMACSWMTSQTTPRENSKIIQHNNYGRLQYQYRGHIQCCYSYLHWYNAGIGPKPLCHQSNTLERQHPESHLHGGKIQHWSSKLHNTYIYISDHCLVTVDTKLKKQSWSKSNLTIMDSSKFTIENLMANFTPPILQLDVILSQVYNQFNTELQKMLDALAPKKTIKQTDKPKNPWFNKHIKQQRKVA